MAGTLKEKTANGLMWSGIANVGIQVLNLAIGIVLGRLLLPSDYGIVGLLTIFITLAGSLSSSGFSNALINAEPTDNDYNSVFWFNITVSLSCYVLLFFSAPLIADFFHQPILIPLSRFLFLCFILSASGMTYNAYLVKNMKNREMAIISLTALVISGSVGVLLAWSGKGVWSLAWQQMIYISVVTIGRFCFVPWHPVFHFDFAPIKRMFPFSVNLLLTNIITTISQQMLTVAFGRLFPVNAVGNYTQSNKWSTMGSQTVSGMLQQITQPVLVSVRNEQSRERLIFRKMLRFTSFISFPCLFGLALVSHEFIIVTIGKKWTECIPLLQILCISGAFLPFYTLYLNLAISHGKSNINMWLTIGQIILQLIFIFLLYSYGMQFMVIAFTCLNILWLGVCHLFTRQLINICYMDVLKDTVPFLLITIAVMTVTYYVTAFIQNLWMLLFARILIAMLLYYGIMRMLNVAIFKECICYITKRKDIT